MNTLSNHRLFGYFTSSLQQDGTVLEEELSSAYVEFEKELSVFSRQKMSALEKLRELYYTRIELETLLQYIIKHPDTIIRIYLHKTVYLVNMEINLLYFILQHPQCDTSEQREDILPPLRWNGPLINLMELITSLDYSGIITDNSGQHQSFAGLVAAFEKLFQTHIPKPYDLRADLARRKKSLSVLLPKLKENYEKNIVNCGIENK